MSVAPIPPSRQDVGDRNLSDFDTVDHHGEGMGRYEDFQ
jgi:hypothetical protein